jgi:transposase
MERQFIGVDLHTNKFTCCYRGEEKDKKETATFELNSCGLADFYRTLTDETYVLVEATITTFNFVRLIQPIVKEVFVANTYELKQVAFDRKNTDKIDADILCRTLKTQIIAGEQLVSSVIVPPENIQELRGLFTTYRLLKKQSTQLKNRIHSLLKEKLYGFTQEEIFTKKTRQVIFELENNTIMSFQIELLFTQLDFLDVQISVLEDKIKEYAEPHMKEIEILTSMKGISVFTAIAIIADIISVDRFKNSKAFTSYLRSAPKVSNSNTSVSIKGTNKKGRKLSATLLTQSLNHMLDASPKLSRWYTKKTEQKKKGLVRTALRRRVFAEIFQMLKKGEYHYGRESIKHELKMRQYRRFLEKRNLLLKSA